MAVAMLNQLIPPFDPLIHVPDASVMGHISMTINEHEQGFTRVYHIQRDPSSGLAVIAILKVFAFVFHILFYIPLVPSPAELEAALCSIHFPANQLSNQSIISSSARKLLPTKKELGFASPFC